MIYHDRLVQAFFTHDVPASFLIERGKKFKSVAKEDLQALRDQLAQEIEEKFPYKPGEDPAMPGIPIAEVAFSNQACSNIRDVTKRLYTKKDSIDKIFKLQAFWDIGDITKELDSRYRKCLAGRMNIGYCHDDEYDEDEYIDSSDQLDRYWSRLKPFLEEGKQLRIWYSDSPEEICGFYHLCTYLKNYDQDFYAVRLPEVAEEEGKPVKIYGWNQASKEVIKAAAESARLLSKEEIRANAMEWEKLKKENAPLRAVINGKLVSVPEEFYDPWILRCIPADEPVREAEVFRQFYENIGSVASGWLVHRIDEMIRMGRVAVTEEHEHVWMQMIRLSNAE